MRRLLPLAALLAIASPGMAARPAGLAGHYHLEGVMETGSELLMTADGKFQWYLSYGALDLFAEGSWVATKDEVVLTAKPAGKDAPEPGFETLKLTIRDGKLIPPDGKGGYVKAK